MQDETTIANAETQFPDSNTFSSEQTQADSRSAALQKVENAIIEVYGPEMWTAVKAGLGVVCSLALKDRSHPLALIYEGPSGTGKSSCVNMFEPDRESTKKVLYRLDHFTPKAFVTQVANVPKEEIGEIDLLPKLTDKVLLVKELAPQFRGSDSELRDRFAILTTVLDGRGYLTASGVHGTRGYTGRHLFNWLGGTTPIPARTDGIMAQLGNRLLRYEFEGQEPTDEELFQFLEDPSHSSAEQLCQSLVNDYLEKFFGDHPVSNVESTTIGIREDMLREIIHLARLICSGRVEITRHEVPELGESELVVGSPEGPFRVALLLKQLAQGLALAGGQQSVNWLDIEVVRHVAFSSIPANRRRVLKALYEEGPSLSVEQVESYVGVSRPTARRYMKELAATGIAKLEPGSGNEGGQITLNEGWTWLQVVRAVDGEEVRAA